MENLSIRKIIEQIASGQIRIPSFQRDFVWEPEDVAFLWIVCINNILLELFCFGELVKNCIQRKNWGNLN